MVFSYANARRPCERLAYIKILPSRPLDRATDSMRQLAADMLKLASRSSRSRRGNTARYWTSQGMRGHPGKSRHEGVPSDLAPAQHVSCRFRNFFATLVFWSGCRSGKTPANRHNALVAQWIEHRFPKPGVAGSIPAGGTTRFSW